MKEQPINMRADEVRAILAGRKTQFRRVFKFCETNQPPACPDKFNPKAVTQPCPYGAPGDRLWMRETFIHEPAEYDLSLSSKPYREASTVYRADVNRDRNWVKWTPSIHMPRKLSRITLEIVSVRVERLNAISRQDAKAEGLWPSPHNGLEMVNGKPYGNAQLAFRALWQSINGPRSWDENPWVWVVDFKVIKGGAQ